MRLLTCQKLPEEESDFFDLMSYFFPKVYDVKYLMKSCKSLKGGLQDVADSLQVLNCMSTPMYMYSGHLGVWNLY